MKPLKKALNHGGTQRRRDRSEAKRKHVQIATVDPDTGCPSCRTVVFRGFLPAKFAGGDSCCLMFITDDRSAKYRHLSRTDGTLAPMEACWWLDEAGVQFRVAGHAVLATSRSEDALLRSAVEDVWSRLGSSSRRTFSWPCPGAPKTADAAGASGTGEDDEPSLDDSHFVLVLLVPHSVDELHLGGKQRRVLYRRDEAAETSTARDALASTTSDVHWTEDAVNP